MFGGIGARLQDQPAAEATEARTPEEEDGRSEASLHSCMEKEEGKKLDLVSVHDAPGKIKIMADGGGLLRDIVVSVAYDEASTLEEQEEEST